MNMDKGPVFAQRERIPMKHGSHRLPGSNDPRRISKLLYDVSKSSYAKAAMRNMIFGFDPKKLVSDDKKIKKPEDKKQGTEVKNVIKNVGSIIKTFTVSTKQQLQAHKLNAAVLKTQNQLVKIEKDKAHLAEQEQYDNGSDSMVKEQKTTNELLQELVKESGGTDNKVGKTKKNGFLGNALGGIWDWMENGLKSIPWVGGILAAAVPLVLAAPGLISLFKKFWPDIKPIFNDIKGMFGDVAKGIYDSLPDGIKNIVDGIKATFDGIRSFFQDPKKFLSDLWDKSWLNQVLITPMVHTFEKIRYNFANWTFQTLSAIKNFKVFGQQPFAGIDPGKKPAMPDWMKAEYEKYDNYEKVLSNQDIAAKAARSYKPMNFGDDTGDMLSLSTLKKKGKTFNLLANKYGSMIKDAATKNHMDPRVLMAFMAQESSGNPNAVSSKGAVGIGQLTTSAIADIKDLGFNITDVKDPAQNIMGSAIYFSHLLKKYKGDMKDALAAYNWGQGHYDKYLEKGGNGPLPEETAKHLEIVGTNLGALDMAFNEDLSPKIDELNKRIDSLNKNSGMMQSDQYQMMVNLIKDAVSSLQQNNVITSDMMGVLKNQKITNQTVITTNPSD